MATRYYTFAENEYYHIFNRGNSKQLIFKSEGDYSRFKKILYIANDTEQFVLNRLDEVNIFDVERKNPLVHIGAYCLMANHFHILLTPAQEGGVPKFMLKLATSYASFFNKKYDRTGRLFEGSYKAKYVDSDQYLKYLFSYIHLNPYRDMDEKKAGDSIDMRDLSTYRHSSLPDYLGETRQVGMILTPEKFPKYFQGVNAQKRELLQWLNYQET